MPQSLITVHSIAPENLEALKDEVNALDQLSPSLEVVERMVKLVADRFSVPISVENRVVGTLPKVRRIVDFKRGVPTRYMSITLESDGRYHCSHQVMADQYQTVETAASAVAWYYIVGLSYPRLWGPRSPK